MNSLIIDGLRLVYRVDGPDQAPPLVLVNSLGTALRMWDPQVQPLSRSLRVVRYDCRGHGSSELSNTPVTIARLGCDLLALLDQLAIERAHICGLSLGGMIVLWLAAEHPERVDRAVFANTAARIGTPATWTARIEAVRAGGMAAVRDAVVARFLSDTFRAGHPQVSQAIGDMLEATNPDGYIAACAALREADLHTLVPNIRVPSLIVAGALDQATLPAQAQELHDAITGSRLAVLPDAAHLSNVEQPQAFTACLLKFFNDPWPSAS
jgi:3-oxoadipate enol-lactonase